MYICVYICKYTQIKKYIVVCMCILRVRAQPAGQQERSADPNQTQTQETHPHTPQRGGSTHATHRAPTKEQHHPRGEKQAQKKQRKQERSESESGRQTTHGGAGRGFSGRGGPSSAARGPFVLEPGRARPRWTKGLAKPKPGTCQLQRRVRIPSGARRMCLGLYTQQICTKARSAVEEQQLTEVLAGDATPCFDEEDATSCRAPACLARKALLRALRRWRCSYRSSAR